MDFYTPDWFVLIKAWIDRDKYGLTLPFLVGARALLSGGGEMQRKDIVKILDEIIQKPVEDYIVHIRWCSDIQSPVFAVYKNNSPQRLRDHCIDIISETTSEISLIVDNNLAAVWKIRAEKQTLLETLVEKSEEDVLNGNYSRYYSIDGLQFGPFLTEDIQFINEAVERTKDL
jgi:hypothetical protein